MNKRAKVLRFILGFLIGAFYIAFGFLLLIIFGNIFPNASDSFINWFFILLFIIYLFVLIYLKKKTRKDGWQFYLRKGLLTFFIIFWTINFITFVFGAWHGYRFSFFSNCGKLGYQHAASIISRTYNNEEEKARILAAEKLLILPFDKKNDYADLQNIEQRIQAENRATQNDFIMFINYIGAQYTEGFIRDRLFKTNYSANIVLNSPPLDAIQNDVFGNPIHEYYDAQGDKISQNDCQALLGNDYYKIVQTYSWQSGCLAGGDGSRLLYFTSDDRYVCGKENLAGFWTY